MARPNLYHVKDRSWDEDIQPLRHPGLGEVSSTLVSAGLHALRLEWWFPPCCPCPWELGFGPSAEFTDLAIVLLCNRPKLKPKWDVHLPGAGKQAGNLERVLRPLIAGPYGSGALPPLFCWPAGQESC